MDKAESNHVDTTEYHDAATQGDHGEKLPEAEVQKPKQEKDLEEKQENNVETVELKYGQIKLSGSTQNRQTMCLSLSFKSTFGRVRFLGVLLQPSDLN